MEQFLSLYDYLGYPAGKNLGKSVSDYAITQSAERLKRDVSTKTYKGLVNLYKKSFLEAYFNNPNYREIIKADRLAWEKKQEDRKKYYSTPSISL
jgi:hypothetical protein